jgi:hypothetical protein
MRAHLAICAQDAPAQGLVRLKVRLAQCLLQPNQRDFHESRAVIAGNEAVLGRIQEFLYERAHGGRDVWIGDVYVVHDREVCLFLLARLRLEFGGLGVQFGRL